MKRARDLTRILVAVAACAIGGAAQKDARLGPVKAATDYASAFTAFDDARRDLYMVRSPKQGKALLDELECALIDVRKAIFDAARLARIGRGNPAAVRPRFTLVLAVRFRRVTGKGGHIRVGDEWLRFDGYYTGLPTRYQAAVDALHLARQRLERKHDAKTAQKVADEITRQILAARRALWDERAAVPPAAKRPG